MAEAKHPPGAVVKIAGPEDAALFERVAEGVFDGPIHADWLDSYLAAGHLHIAIAIADDQIVSMASGVTYHHPDKPSELFINETGTSPRYQRRGFGKAALACLLAHGQGQGARAAWVLTERENTAACAFYQSLGGTPDGDAIVMFTFDLSTG